jgi:NAD(P)-dependent dehydrogenase (short-subunit alcohol dehydrogenase family)
VIAMSKTLAVEWARYNVRNNCIAPGPIQTEGAASRLWAGFESIMQEKIPLGRFGTAEEISQAAAYLASDAAAYVTGTTLTVDGGESLNQGEFPEELIDVLREQTRKP